MDILITHGRLARTRSLHLRPLQLWLMLGALLLALLLLSGTVYHFVFLKAVRPLLPAALLRHVRSGPSDDEGWTMLAGNPAVAAKLRQLQPRLEAALKQKGFQRTGIRIRVQSPTNP